MKEQKVKINEMIQCRDEAKATYHERVSHLEEQLQEDKKKSVQVEVMKKDKVRLVAQVRDLT